MLDQQLCFRIIDGLQEGVYIIDRNRCITFWNTGAERVTGYHRSEMVGVDCGECGLAHISDESSCMCEGGCHLLKAKLQRQELAAKLYLRHKDGHRLPVMVRAIPIEDSSGESSGVISIFNITTTTSELMDRLHHLEQLALLDTLTELLNRRGIEASLQTRIGELDRYDWPFGVLFIDIDRFKRINDVHGHILGDRVLRVVSKTLLASLRSFDQLGRWGGEEFVAIIANVDEDELFLIANRARHLVEHAQIENDGETIQVTISIGAAMARRGEKASELLQRADGLMYGSKLSGRNRVTTEHPKEIGKYVERL